MAKRRKKVQAYLDALIYPLGDTGYERVEERPLADLELWKDHRRLTVFYHKGFECANPKCNNVGTRLIKGSDFGGNMHWDVYTDDLVLMTVDHIIPLSKGGSDDLRNKNPMCRPCNTAKSNKIQPQYLTEDVDTDVDNSILA